MAVYAGVQKTAANPSAFLQGVTTQTLLDNYTFGAIAATDLTVGKACFYVSDAADNAVQALGTSGGPFAGVVRRSNANAMAFSDSLLGYSLTIPAGQEASVITRGSVAVPVAAALSTLGSPVRGDFIYVVTATGAFNSVGTGGTPASGSVKTNFVVGKVTSWTANAVIEITNTQNVGALA